MARVTIQDALDYCLVNPDDLSVEQLLAKFPEYRDELQPLLALSAGIALIEPPPVPSDRRAAMKQRLMDASSAAALVPQTTRVAPAPQIPPARPWWATGSERLAALLRRPAWAGVLGAIALVALLWWSAASSLPDSPLYTVKLNTEGVLRNFRGGTSGQIEAHLQAAASRLGDIKEMQRRNKLAQVGPAVESYRSSIAASASLWEKTTGDARTDLAKKIYVETVRGVVDLASIAPEVPNIPEQSVRADISQTIAALQTLRLDAQGTLASANIDVNALLLEADIQPSSLPTPLPRFALATPTVTLPVVAGVDSTRSAVATQSAQSAQSTMVAGATQVAVSSAARLTAEVIVAASGGATSPAGISSGRLSAARTVLAGGTDAEVAPARQTVLAAAAALSSPTSLPTNTKSVQNTPTTPARSTALATGVATASPRAASPTRTPVVPSTSLPRYTTTVPKPTNTRIIPGPTLPVPTIVRVIATRVVQTILPTSTFIPTATARPSATPMPTNTPIIMPTVVALPTFTVQLPPPPTRLLNTPTPVTTPPTPLPVTPPPLPTQTIIVIPTLTVDARLTPSLPTVTATVLPLPPTSLPLPPTSLPLPPTSLPLPTQLACPLELEDVDISCVPGAPPCLGAAVLLQNPLSNTVSARWTADLRVRLATGGFFTLLTQSATQVFPPGQTAIAPEFCVSLPPGAVRAQIRFTLLYAACSVQLTSRAIQPCGLP